MEEENWSEEQKYEVKKFEFYETLMQKHKDHSCGVCKPKKCEKCQQESEHMITEKKCFLKADPTSFSDFAGKMCPIAQEFKATWQPKWLQLLEEEEEEPMPKVASLGALAGMSVLRFNRFFDYSW